MDELLDRSAMALAMLHPPYSRPAPRHYRPMLTPFDFVCTGLFNVLELPSTVVPTGFSRQGCRWRCR